MIDKTLGSSIEITRGRESGHAEYFLKHGHFGCCGLRSKGNVLSDPSSSIPSIFQRIHVKENIPVRGIVSAATSPQQATSY